jgi:hypothetical protein
MQTAHLDGVVMHAGTEINEAFRPLDQRGQNVGRQCVDREDMRQTIGCYAMPLPIADSGIVLFPEDVVEVGVLRQGAPGVLGAVGGDCRGAIPDCIYKGKRSAKVLSVSRATGPTKCLGRPYLQQHASHSRKLRETNSGLEEVREISAITYGFMASKALFEPAAM